MKTKNNIINDNICSEQKKRTSTLENRVEILEKQLIDKKRALKKYQNCRMPYLKSDIIFWALLELAIIVFIPIVSVLLYENGTIPLCDTPFGIMKMTTFVRGIVSIVSVPVVSFCGSWLYKKEKHMAQIKHGLIEEIKFLEKQLKIEKQNAKQKLKTKVKNLDCEAKTEFDKILNRRLEIIFQLGTLREFLLKKLENGTLNEELEKMGLTREEIAKSERYIKKNFTMLPKNKNHRKN